MNVPISVFHSELERRDMVKKKIEINDRQAENLCCLNLHPVHAIKAGFQNRVAMKRVSKIMASPVTGERN